MFSTIYFQGCIVVWCAVDRCLTNKTEKALVDPREMESIYFSVVMVK